MKNKRLLACLLASMMICGTFTACGEEESSETSSSTSSSSESSAEESESSVSESSAESSEASESSADESSKAPVAVETVEVEEAVVAGSGDAYLQIADGQWWIQYNGNVDDNGYMLAYDAGVVPITGNGDYTVSVNAGTNGFKLDVTGEATGEYTPGGVSFLGVMINDGETLFPGAVITVNEIRVDGSPITMVSQAYTSSDDGKVTRANLYNPFMDGKPSSDARTVEGNLYTDMNPDAPIEACANYSPVVIDPADFVEWTTVEVDFTISGIAE